VVEITYKTSLTTTTASPRSFPPDTTSTFNSWTNHVLYPVSHITLITPTGLGHNQAQSLIDQITRQYEGGRGGPPGMGFGGGMGMGGGMGGPPVMRSANPPFMGGGPPPGQSRAVECWSLRANFTCFLLLPADHVLTHRMDTIAL